MRKTVLIVVMALLLSSCSALSEMVAITRCEFRLQSIEDPEVCHIKVNEVKSWSDLSFMQGQVVAGRLLNKNLPVEFTVNIEARNPGTKKAAVNSIQWIAMIDDLQVAEGEVSKRVEVAPSGGTNIIPLRIQADLFDYLEGDNPKAMLNFALNQINLGKEDSHLILKIRPSMLIGGQEVRFPEYFELTKEFKSGN